MLFPASGTGQFAATSTLVIRLLRFGCANRPFFHVAVSEHFRDKYGPVVEQLGTYDPIPNEYEEKLVSLNYERLRYWIGRGAITSQPVEQLLGLSGFYPIPPRLYMTAWRNRLAAEEAAKKEAENVDKKDAEEISLQEEDKNSS